MTNEQLYITYSACTGNRQPHEAHCWQDAYEGLTWRCRGRNQYGRYNRQPSWVRGVTFNVPLGWRTPPGM